MQTNTNDYIGLLFVEIGTGVCTFVSKTIVFEKSTHQLICEIKSNLLLHSHSQHLVPHYTKKQ